MQLKYKWSLWKWLFGDVKQIFSNGWNMFFEKCEIEKDVIFVKQASEKWNVDSGLWNSNHRKWNCNVSVWNCLFRNVKQFISKEWNKLFEKCAIKLYVLLCTTSQWKVKYRFGIVKQ